MTINDKILNFFYFWFCGGVIVCFLIPIIGIFCFSAALFIDPNLTIKKFWSLRPAKNLWKMGFFK